MYSGEGSRPLGALVSVLSKFVVYLEFSKFLSFISAPALKCRRAIAIPLASASASASTYKMLGQMLKSWNFSFTDFFVALSFAYHTNKAPYNKSLWQARIRWPWHLWFLARLHFSAEELLLYPRRRRPHPRPHPRPQNVGANFKVLEFKSFCIFSCILTLLIILINPLTTKAYDRRASGDCGTSGVGKRVGTGCTYGSGLFSWKRKLLFKFKYYWVQSIHTLPLMFVILVHLSRRLKFTIVITHCPSTVRPSLTFISILTLKPQDIILRNFTGSKNAMSSTKFVFFFYFFSATAERNSMKFDRKQDINVSTKFVCFGPIEN